SVLQGVQSEGDDCRRVLTAENAEHPALIVEMVVGFARERQISIVRHRWPPHAVLLAFWRPFPAVSYCSSPSRPPYPFRGTDGQVWTLPGPRASCPAATARPHPEADATWLPPPSSAGSTP